MKILRTWFLRTKDGRDVFQDLLGNATFENGPNTRFEFIEGQHPREDKEALASEVSDLLGIECVWVRGPD